MADQQTRAGRRPDASSQTLPELAGVTHFLGIGIDEYAHWPRLHNAVKDVHAITDLLINDYGLQVDHTRLLLNDQATEANIVDVFEALTREVQPQDSVLIYYAGHGHLNERGRGFWVPVDAPQEQVVRYIRNSTIKDYIGDISSLHTLLISDSCFSGSLFSSGVSRSADLAAEELARLPSRWAICSGRHDEVVADGPNDGHSPFAESILEVLGHNVRPLITTGFLVQQVIEQTRANYDQLPDGGPLQGVGHKRGQFVFRQQTGKGASRLWARIEALPEATLPELKSKKNLLRQYCQQYPKGNNYREALALGRRLEHKRQFLEVYDSEFGLLALLEHNTPYQTEIQRRLTELRQQDPGASTSGRVNPQLAFRPPPASTQPARFATAIPSSPSSELKERKKIPRFWQYAGLIILVTVVLSMVLFQLGVFVSGVFTQALYMIVLPGAVIWSYHQRTKSWRGAWRLSLIAMVGMLLFNTWQRADWLISIPALILYPIIGMLSIVPTLVHAAIKGEKIQLWSRAGGPGAARVVSAAVVEAHDRQAVRTQQPTYWTTFLIVVGFTAVSMGWLMMNSKGPSTERLDQTLILCILAAAALFVAYQIWRHVRVSLSYFNAWTLALASALSFLVVGVLIGEGFELVLLFFFLVGATVFVLPLWIAIWVKKRKIRRQSS